MLPRPLLLPALALALLAGLGLAQDSWKREPTYFLALEVGEELTDRLAEVQDELYPTDVPVDWSRPVGFHVSLVYLGRFPGEKLEALRAALRPVGRDHRPFTLLYRGVGSFPWRDEPLPRVIWAKPRALGATLDQLQADLQATCLAHGAEEPRYAFSPHVTLGRARFPPKPGDLAGRLEALAKRSLGSESVTHFALLGSDPEGREGVYQVVERFPLGAP